MSCAPGIYSRFPMTSPPGGSWVYVGFNATVDTGPWTGTPAIPLVNVAAGTNLASWGYDFALVEDGKTPGYYRFTYNYIGGSDDVTIRVQSNLVCAGQNAGITIEAGDAFTLNLFTLISGGVCPSPQTGGTWTNVDSSPGFNAGTGILTTGSIPEGTYHFEYTISASNVLDCDNCITTATVTLTVSSAATLDATIGKSDVSCTYSYRLAHPVTDTSNQVYFTIADNDQNATLSYKAEVLNCDSEIVFSETVVIPTPMSLGTSTRTGLPMATGGWIDSMRVHSSLGTFVTVPLGPLTATYSGVGGTTNATALTYNASTPSIFFNAIRIALVNYLGVLGYVENTDYKIEYIGMSSPLNTVLIAMGCKRNPTSRWLGIRKVGSLLTFKPTGGGVVTTGNGSNYYTQVNFERMFSALPCLAGANMLHMIGSFTPSHINLTTLDLDVIDLVGADLAVTPTGTLSKSCTDKLLTANPTGCGGTLSYEWQTGATTQSIKVPYIAGVTHTIQVSCTSPSSSVTKSVTL